MDTIPPDTDACGKKLKELIITHSKEQEKDWVTVDGRQIRSEVYEKKLQQDKLDGYIEKAQDKKEDIKSRESILALKIGGMPLPVFLGITSTVSSICTRLPCPPEEAIIAAVSGFIGAGIACLAVKGLQGIKTVIDEKILDSIVAKAQAIYDDMQTKGQLDEIRHGDYYKDVLDSFEQVTEKHTRQNLQPNQINQTNERTM
jgi:hypothetical protein